jgi:bifunctional non-homologous end joining protein LigD
MAGSLDTYRGKRDFRRTPEPKGRRSSTRKALRFVVQKHDATRLHYDFRLEHDGVLKSWAVPKEPSYDPKDRRLAVQTEDHPLDYATFEGEIPEPEYGAGTVVIWDRGRWEPLGDPGRGLADGKLDFELHGDKLEGRWTLVRMARRGARKRPENWLLIKRSEAGAAHKARPARSVKGAPARRSRAASAASARGHRARSVPRPQRVKLTNPDRVLFPDPEITKRQLARYWEEISEVALPSIVNRPLTLYRCPEGYARQCFYQKHVGVGVPEAVARVAVDEDEAPYAMIDGVPALLGLVQIGVLEIHVWGARAEHLDRPDVIVLDLDPAEDVRWRDVADAAVLIEARLRSLGLRAFLRLTGGKGLHLVVPVVPGPRWPAIKKFTRALVTEIVRDEPKRFTGNLAKSARSGKIFIDYLRNDREATAIASYSPRARAGAPVALPIAWDELDRAATAPPRFGLLDVPALVRARRRDPWEEFESARSSLVD